MIETAKYYEKLRIAHQKQKDEEKKYKSKCRKRNKNFKLNKDYWNNL